MKFIIFLMFFLLSVRVKNSVHCIVTPELEPVQLLDFTSNDNKTVTLNKASVENLFLNPLVSDRDVVVVSIAGALRKGKSFLLNYMLRYMYANYKTVSAPNRTINELTARNWIGDSDEPLKGFSWKSSTKRETVGIMFWSDVFLYDSPNGDKIAIFLMDTQGLFDHSSSPTDNIRIFSLSSLISSVQIINIYSMIEESHLEYLQFATEIARFTAVESESNSKPFQKLMFIIRDWISPEEYDYGYEGGNNFIKMYLRIKDFHTSELKTVREYLKRTFESITCFLMPYPGKSVARNSSYDGRWSDIDEEFVDVMTELFPILLAPSNLTVKTVNGVPIKAYELLIFIRQYVDMFKSENLPEAKSIFESTLDNQFQILTSKSVEVYLESISTYQDHISNFDEIGKLHEISKAIAMKFFNEEKKFGSNEDGEVYKMQLDNKLEKAFAEWKPITVDFLNKIEEEQSKAREQKKLAGKTEVRVMQSKKEAEIADQKYFELQKMIELVRYDTQESRQEAEIIRKKLDQAKLEREQALVREKEINQQYQELKHKVEIYEQQLYSERRRNSFLLQQRMNVVRKRDGILQWFADGVTAFLGFVKKPFDNVGKLFNIH
ncbi:CLUMA_CG000565, isoform A [Clunio marinus]|uniref:CLUMA_CG000565, isoform A n=1 Tax=Clunio marinus TaxID=568069 RepID=A0A1J1HH41_9DIPT|nr:CLUMA_CG000565, isoform A [Clunio marinus]